MDEIDDINRDNSAFSVGYKNFKSHIQKNVNSHSDTNNQYRPKQPLEIEEILEDLIIRYKEKGYKIPDLSDEKNIFKMSPMLVEDDKMFKFYQANKDTHNFNKDLLVLNNMRFAIVQNGASKIVRDRKGRVPGSHAGEGNDDHPKRAASITHKVPEHVEIDAVHLMHDVKSNYYNNLKTKKMIIELSQNREGEGMDYKEKSKFQIGIETPKKVAFNPNETLMTSLKSEIAAFKSKHDKKEESPNRLNTDLKF